MNKHVYANSSSVKICAVHKPGKAYAPLPKKLSVKDNRMSNPNSTVKPCVKCGATERDKRGDCIPCSRARGLAYAKANVLSRSAANAARYVAKRDAIKAAAAAYYAANKEKAKATNEKWRLSNPEKRKAAADAWKLANQEKARGCIADWKAAHPDSLRIYNQNRRAKKRASGGKLSSGLALKLFSLQKGKCACCKKPLGDNYHLDHIMPIAMGGTNTDDNIQLLRSVCNMQKNAKHPIDFMQQRGFLL